MNAMTTIAGWVGKNPVLIETPGGSHTTIRVAHTPRYRNQLNVWVDGETQWFAVKAWNDLAVNACASLRRGDPVIVSGRVLLEEWDSDEGRQKMLVLRASALGHDLSRGRTSFTRVVRVTDGASDEDAGTDATGTGSSPATSSAEPEFVVAREVEDAFDAVPADASEAAAGAA